ncbi:Alpha/Beta hydrolase protein [Mycena amicta]|nr:Alpha/Beta hydrolase protein [Mycena amicta]
MAILNITPYLAYLLPSLIAAFAFFALRALALPLHSNELPSATDPGLSSLPPDSRVRRLYPEDWTSGGAYVTLPMGRMRYWLVGPESGKKVVLIPGLTTPSFAFAPIVPILVAGGLRVLMYDLFGRGYSDAPRTATYDANLYVTQLALLLQYLRWERTGVVGYSMGGPIAAAFVASFPHLVESKVVLLASAGLSEVPMALSGYRHLWFMPWLVWREYSKGLPGTVSSTDTPYFHEIIPLQAMHLSGYRRALASSLHEGPIVRMRWPFKSPNWAGRQVATVDITVPPSDSVLIQSLLESHAKPEVRLLRVLGAAHDLPLAHAATVGNALVDFFNEKV